jgi:hypothetical protein
MRTTGFMDAAAATDQAPSHAPPVIAPHRFLLDATDRIMLAPAVGPTTARRLEEAGVLTIGNLLASDPESLATQLKSRRVSSQTIQAWQAQANLMCCVPNLRAAEAQILVACGVRQVDQLRRAHADELWQRVRSFLPTGECRRIIRSGKLPDAECVARWVQNAQHARSLHAA